MGEGNLVAHVATRLPALVALKRVLNEMTECSAAATAARRPRRVKAV
jgi:hypothetical protein